MLLQLEQDFFFAKQGQPFERQNLRFDLRQLQQRFEVVCFF